MAEKRQAAGIPNLLSLRGNRTSRGRGRGHGSQNNLGTGERSETSEASKDRVVQQTDQDASDSRMSAVSSGYLKDDFASAFSPRTVNRRYPIINRGMFEIILDREASFRYSCSCRYVCAHHSNRPAGPQVPLRAPQPAKANRITGSRLRYTLFPSHNDIPQHPSPVSRIGLCQKHAFQNQYHKSLPSSSESYIRL